MIRDDQLYKGISDSPFPPAWGKVRMRGKKGVAFTPTRTLPHQGGGEKRAALAPELLARQPGTLGHRPELGP
jgi:hypothetical protein